MRRKRDLGASAPCSTSSEQGGLSSKNWRGSTGFPVEPLHFHQSAYKPGSVREDLKPRATTIPLRRRLPGASSNLPGRQDPDIDPGVTFPLARGEAPCRPYSVLLPVGFAVPPALPQARCALTAPFHPCPLPPCDGGRSVLCGTFPGL